MEVARHLTPVFVTLAFVAAGNLARAAEPRQAEDAKAIIDKSLKALGGAEKIRKFGALTVNGTCMMQGVEDRAFSGSFEGPTRLRLKVDTSADHGKMVVVINGEKGWIREDDKVKELASSELDPMAEFLHAMCLPDLLLTLKGEGYTLGALAKEKIDGKKAVGIKVTHKKRKEVRLFFDKTTDLPIKSQVKLDTKDSSEEWCDFFFSAYKDIDGIKHFTHLKIQHGNQCLMEFDIQEVKLSDKLDSEVFAKP